MKNSIFYSIFFIYFFTFILFTNKIINFKITNMRCFIETNLLPGMTKTSVYTLYDANISWVNTDKLRFLPARYVHFTRTLCH